MNKLTAKLVLPLLFLSFAFMFCNTEAKAADMPKEYIEKLADVMITNITSKNGDKVENFRKLFINNVDVESIARFVLGAQWRSLDKAKQKDFMKAFTEVNVLTWSKRFDEYKGEKITFQDSTPAQSPKQFFVRSSVDLGEGQKAEVVWRLKQIDKSFKIIDIVVEGVSMSITYRNDYNSVIQNSPDGIDGLIHTLNVKIEELSAK
ncbi:MAG: phospholipid-binding protein MlaC [Alphaproteobacteria bacterium]